MDDRDGAPLVHPVIERGSAVPSSHEQLFDLGPDDGSEVYLDLYEHRGIADSDDPADHRVVATAHLQPTARRRAEVTVTFDLGADGRFVVRPADMWTLSWHPAEIDVLSVHRHLVDPSGRSDRADRVMVRPLIASWTVSPEVDAGLEPSADGEPEASDVPDAPGSIVTARTEDELVDESGPASDEAPDTTGRDVVDAADQPATAEPVTAEPVTAEPVTTDPDEGAAISAPGTFDAPIVGGSGPASEPDLPPVASSRTETQRESVGALPPPTPDVVTAAVAISVPVPPPAQMPASPSEPPRAGDGDMAASATDAADITDTTDGADATDTGPVAMAVPTEITPPAPSVTAAASMSTSSAPFVPAPAPTPAPASALSGAGAAAMPQGLAPTPAIAAALQRCERLLSYEVGQMVAVRSVFALLDCPDDADPRAVDAAAARLERSMSERDDDLADAIRTAVATIRRSVEQGADDWYFGGTLGEVETELARVVEHLMVVVGFVSNAEQRRLVLDVESLGLGHALARRVVHDLVMRAQDERLQAQLAADDDSPRTVHLHPQLGRFVLDAHADGAGVVRSDDVARASIRMRVLLDVR